MTLFFPLVSTIVIAGVAAATDFRTGKIPNWLTLGSLPFGVLLQIGLGVSRAGLRGAGGGAVFSLIGIVLCGLVPLLLYRFARMGGGDVKLFMAIGAFCGPIVGLEIQRDAYLAFALYVPARLIYEGHLLRVLGDLAGGFRNALRSRRNRQPLPAAWKMSFRLGPAILLGVLATAVGSWMQL